MANMPLNLLTAFTPHFTNASSITSVSEWVRSGISSSKAISLKLYISPLKIMIY